jgi:hypothetical protein
MPDMTGWTPVTNAAGETAGWMAAPDSDEPDLDWFEADRVPRAGRRAAAIDEVAAAFGEECFDPETVWDASTLSDVDLDSAGHIAVTLAKIENHARPWE